MIKKIKGQFKNENDKNRYQIINASKYCFFFAQLPDYLNK